MTSFIQDAGVFEKSFKARVFFQDREILNVKKTAALGEIGTMFGRSCKQIVLRISGTNNNCVD